MPPIFNGIKVNGIIADGLKPFTTNIGYAITSNGARLTSTRNTVWGNLITHLFTVTFSSAAAATNFFSTGGEIRTSAQRAGGSVHNQNNDWTALLISMGSVAFGQTATTSTGSGVNTSVGFVDLTGTYQTVFSILGQGQYTTDEYKLEARADSTTVIRFRASYTDAIDNLVDETVDGTIEHFVDDKRQTTQAVPVYVTVTELSAGT